jgi:hypothetical protein
MNLPKMGPTEMRAEIIRLHHENFDANTSAVAGSDCGNTSRVSGGNSRRPSAHEEEPPWIMLDSLTAQFYCVWHYLLSSASLRCFPIEGDDFLASSIFEQ